MKYLVSYQTGVLGLKPELEDGDVLYAKVPDDFMFQPEKDYIIYSDGTYNMVDKPKATEEHTEELG